jgi:hypothetical protein
MLATKYLLTLQILQPYHIERRERIFYAVLLDTTIKTTTTFNTRRGARNHGGGVSIVTIVTGVLVLAVSFSSFLLAFQYGLVREEDLWSLSSSDVAVLERQRWG